MVVLRRRRLFPWALAICCASAPAARARADGGELLLEGSYLPAISYVRGVDAPYQAGRERGQFAHAVGLQASYGLSHRLGAGIGCEVAWPQAVAAHDVAYLGKEHASFAARRTQVHLPLVLTLRSDRKQVWNVQAAVFIGLQLSRWDHASFALVRGQQTLQLPGAATGWKQSATLGLAPSIVWSLGERISVTLGPRITVTQGGSLAWAARASFGWAIPAGPSW